MNPDIALGSVPPLPPRLPEGSLSADFVTIFKQAVLRSTRARLDNSNSFRFERRKRPNANGHWIGGSLDLGGHFPNKPWLGFKLHAERGDVELSWWIEAALPHSIAGRPELGELFRNNSWSHNGEFRRAEYFRACGRVEPGSTFARSISALEAGIDFLIDRLSPALAHLQ
jgi:hypothetical protein